MAIHMIRCAAADPRFTALVAALDDDLRRRYREVQDLYTPHNSVAGIETAILALDGERPVGCGCFKQHGDDAVELKRIYVPDAERRRGIGALIVEGLGAWARELGFARAILETGTNQPEAVALYERCGYSRIATFGPYADLPASICMGKALTAR